MGPHKNNKEETGQSNTFKKLSKKDKKKWKEKKLLKRVGPAKTKEIDVESSNSDDREAEQIQEISTCSIAVPGSILENAQSPELRTYLAGQIARAACVYKIDEVVVYDDLGSRNIADATFQDGFDNEGRNVRHCCIQLARLLQYLECPQYLRKYFFPLHKDLQYAGLLNPLDAPHHLRQNDEFPFREGVTTTMPVKGGTGSAVNCGLKKDVRVDKNLTAGIRVTVKLQRSEGSKKLQGIVVPPSLPYAETGVYWGYTVRLADSLGAVFSQSPYPEGYDLTVGTSERGDIVDDLHKKGPRQYHHAIIVFGGLQGLEAALENDDVLTVDDPSLLFDCYLNTCPGQGSRTIRTEEAILITLAELRTKLVPKFRRTTETEQQQ